MNPAAPGSTKCPNPSRPAPVPLQAPGGGTLTPPGMARTANTTTNKLETTDYVESGRVGRLQGTDSKDGTTSRGQVSPSPSVLDEFGLPTRTRSQTPQRNNHESPNVEIKATPVEDDKAPGPATAEVIKDRGLSEGKLSKEETPAAVTFEAPEFPTEKGTVSQPTSTAELPYITKSSLPADARSESRAPNTAENLDKSQPQGPEVSKAHKRASSQQMKKISEWSHQHITAEKEDDSDEGEEEDDGWQDMPALGEFDVYDDYGRLVARGAKQEDDAAVYQGLGGAGRGYTRVQADDDAQSVTSLDDDTKYLFKEPESNAIGVEDEQRDPLSQLQATKNLLTEGQRIAYVGMTRLTISQMIKEFEAIKPSRSSKKYLAATIDGLNKWRQQMMIRLYTHMDIDPAEQVMIEQLAVHGVQPADLVPPLMKNARVDNPLSNQQASPRPSTSSAAPLDPEQRPVSSASSGNSEYCSLPSSSSPPPYENHLDEDLPEVKTPSEMPTSSKIDIDLRWTVLCDLFLVLIADSTYDARSRLLLERVGNSMDVSWSQICRFEKRVIDALEMQEEKSKESWDEADHMEARRKEALKRRYMVMGLATVGGGLVIGLSAGLLAPVIGAGLAAGFTTIGITGTGAFLGGAGGTALIASGATLTGGTIAVRASNRRTGAVKTFEYRPLHNNKKVNLIVTVSGWMTGKVDDVRLPFSTVDPIMGDIYSVLWEPEMLQSMGATINILATEALTQGLQQVLGNTVLVALMASLQLPIVLTKLSYLIDNPWNVSLVRANAAGLIMADSLMARNLGNRPITMVGFSLGSRVIFSCLKELAKKGAHGLVQNVYLFGSPIVANKDEYLKARSVVSGKFVNGYASNDWILGYLFRATSGGIMRVAGLAPVNNVPGIENMDVTEFVNGHMAYRAAMPRILREMGWEVMSDEFTEIEDPDPEKHHERQRELIREIDEARKQAEAKPDKKKFGLFKRGKLAQKKGWETYDVDQSGQTSRNSSESALASPNTGVLFDIDAIRAELAAEQMEVKQLESTMPPMKLDLSSPSPLPRDSLSEKPSMSSSVRSKTEIFEPNGPGKSVPRRSATDLGNRRDSFIYDDDIQMTFDTSYNSPPSFSPQNSSSSLPRNLSSPHIQPMPTSGTSPRFGALNPGHNAWADDDYDERKESDMQMTFE
ncbi:hypothetical protein AJ79_00814 [Helicocarpus griseus UAMH5409]|uniref:DUF726 domain-containing protein n=1 Tax=Helicocarpus griseus UAMH5409 TaxID=1447875 RepID=A0A2B7Y9I6_9EURO|nr:hypothetical protein AJ79_00814 [Helicocarpus griseus UAMH5409]